MSTSRVRSTLLITTLRHISGAALGDSELLGDDETEELGDGDELTDELGDELGELDTDALGECETEELGEWLGLDDTEELGEGEELGEWEGEELGLDDTEELVEEEGECEGEDETELEALETSTFILKLSLVIPELVGVPAGVPIILKRSPSERDTV